MQKIHTVRDGDGKNPEELGRQLCRYYDQRNEQDADKLPRVTRKNVLILKYYSFENYFFNPQVMTALRVVESPEAKDILDAIDGFIYFES